MSSFIELTPSVEIAIENPILNKTYPNDDGDTVSAIIDTGYEGFLLVPMSVFQELEMNKLWNGKRAIALANGGISTTHGAYGTLRIPHLSLDRDGYVETFRGVNEIVIGAEALSGVKVLLDYCSRRVRVEKCP